MQDIRMDTFIAVCDYRNLTRAADFLGLTQPAVSRQMKSLEEHYGTALFRYEGKKLFLTPAGEMLCRCAKAARSDEEKLREKLKGRAKKTLCFGSTPTPAEFMIPPILSDYLKEYPIAKVSLTVKNTEALLSMVDNGRIDFAVVEGNFPKKEYEYRLFSRQNYSPVCAKHQEIPGGPMENLLSYPLIVREPGSGNREILEYSLRRQNLFLGDFKGLIETNDIKVQKALVEQGLGIAFLFETAVREKENLKKIATDGFPLEHEINIVWRKNSVFEEEYQAVAEYFVRAAALHNDRE